MGRRSSRRREEARPLNPSRLPCAASASILRECEHRVNEVPKRRRGVRLSARCSSPEVSGTTRLGRIDRTCIRPAARRQVRSAWRGEVTAAPVIVGLQDFGTVSACSRPREYQDAKEVRQGRAGAKHCGHGRIRRPRADLLRHSGRAVDRVSNPDPDEALCEIETGLSAG